MEAAAAALGSLFTSGTVASGVAAGAAATAAGALVNRLSAPKPPGIKPPVAMPDQASVEAGRRRSLLEQMARRGRQSTILTGDLGDTLG